MKDYEVVKYTLDGKRISSISGLGRNKGTWDSNHSKRTAQKYRKDIQKEDSKHIYKVECVYCIGIQKRDDYVNYNR